MIEVKVIQIPGVIRDVALNEGATVSDALRAAGIDLTTETVTLNGLSTTGSAQLSANDRIIVAKSAKGA